MTRAHRILAAAALLPLLSSCRGSAGRAGLPGPDGPPGVYRAVPRVDSITPETLSHGSVVTVQGRDFSLDPTADEVWVDGVKGDVIAASANAITVTHLAPSDVTAHATTLVVVANHQTSNAVPVHAVPSGSVVSVPIHASHGITAMAPLPDGTLALLATGGEILDVTADGDISHYGDGLAAGAANPVARNDGIYYVTATGVRRWFDTLDYQVMAVSGGTPTSVAFDDAGNLYVAVFNGATTTIQKRDYATGAVTDFLANSVVHVTQMVGQGGNLYVWGSAGATSPIEKIPFATPAENVIVADIDGHTMAGDGTYLYVAVNGVVQQVDANGTVTQYSAKNAGTAVDQLAWFAGTVFYRIGDQVWRMPDNATFTAFVSPIDAPRSLGAFATLVAGSSATCGTGDSQGGVLYEILDDGRLRHIVSDFCARPYTLGLNAGSFYAASAQDDSIQIVDPVADTMLPLIGTGNMVSPLFVVSDAQGNLYVPNDDGAGGWRVSKYDPNGALLASDFVSSFAEAPAAGAVVGTDLVLGFAGSRRLLGVDQSTGGSLVAFTDSSFRPVVGGMSLAADGSLLVTDTGSQTLWSVAANGSEAQPLGPSGTEETWFASFDGSYESVGADTIEKVMP